jgi:hypothetical protein
LGEQDGHRLGHQLSQLHLVRSQFGVPAADVGGQAAQFGAQDLLGDGLAGMHAQAAASAGLARRAQAAQLPAQVVGCAQDQGLERVDRRGSRRGCLGSRGEQDPQRLPGAVRAWLRQPLRRQGIAGRPGRIGWIGLPARALAGPCWPSRLGDQLAVGVQVRGMPVDVSPLSAATLAVWGLLYGPAEYDILESVW